MLPSDVKARHDKMVELVERTLDLHKQLPKAKTPHEQESVRSECKKYCAFAFGGLTCR
jgi:hypothetical protein